MSKRNKKAPTVKDIQRFPAQRVAPIFPTVYTIQVDAKMLRLCQLVSQNIRFQKDLDNLMKKHYS